MTLKRCTDLKAIYTRWDFKQLSNVGRERGREKEEMVTDVKLEGGGCQCGENKREMNKRRRRKRDCGEYTVQTNRHCDGTLCKHARKQRSL